MIDTIQILMFALFGAAFTLALVLLGNADVEPDRGELVAYGIGGSLFGGLLGSLLLWWRHSQRRQD